MLFKSLGKIDSPSNGATSVNTDGDTQVPVECDMALALSLVSIAKLFCCRFKNVNGYFAWSYHTRSPTLNCLVPVKRKNGLPWAKFGKLELCCKLRNKMNLNH